MSDINKVRCPKFRKILFRYKSNLVVTDGQCELYTECPECRAYIQCDLTSKDNYKKKVSGKEADEIIDKFNEDNGGR